MAGPKTDLGNAIRATLELAGIGAHQIGRVIMVGGSSLMQLVSDAVCDVCPDATVLRSEAFTAVIDGLAIATGEVR